MVKYVNSQGREIDLSQFPVRLKEAVFHTYEWGYEGSAQRFGVDIDYFKKDPQIYDILVSFTGTNEQKKQLLNDFCDLTEYDVQNNLPGKLYVENYYIHCFIVSSSTEPTEYSYTDRTMQVLCPYPFWIQEINYQFLPEAQASNEGNNSVDKKLPNGIVLPEFKFDFARVYGDKQVNNPSHMPCNFQMVIYGYTENPSIIINNHSYMVEAVVYEGERLIIDSRDKTVIKIGRLGEITNLYNARNKVQSVFEKIPSGNNTVSWSGDFGIDLTLYDERSEPRWSLQFAIKI